MRRLIIGFMAPVVAGAALLLAACGGTSSSNGPGSASAAPAPLVSTRAATVDGKSVTMLTDPSGMTLYYFTLDKSGTVACTGSCTSIWKPLLAPAGVNTPTASASLPGTLGIVNDPNGAQVTYNGHPLYTYTKDKQPGDTTGNDVLDKWYVVTSDVAPLAAPS